MIKKVICDKFKQKEIVFKNGLNCILGDDVGTNSIGKSTMLMILDFIFGGNDYIEITKDVVQEVGHHSFKFEFEFNDEKFFFIRETENYKEISICDKNYNVINKQSLSNYLQFLHNRYNLNEEISFRDSVGRYSRIYQKENTNEHRPLDVVHKESGKKAVLALLKLFKSYNMISESLANFKAAEEKKKTLTNAQKHDFVPNINKTAYNNNLKLIDKTTKEIEDVKKVLINNSVDIEELLSEEIYDLRRKKSGLINKKNFLQNKLDSIIKYNVSKKKDIIDYEEVQKYFSNINIDRVKEVDQFHFDISKIVDNEIKNYKKSLEKELKITLSNIDEINLRFDTLCSVDTIPRASMEAFSRLNKLLNDLKSQSKYFTEKENIDEEYKGAKERYNKAFIEQLEKIEEDINSNLVKLNKYIYKDKISPKISFNENDYIFTTPKDTGTGSNHKGLIIFDLCILNLTSLPLLMHDSIFLKQIQDDAMEKLFELYQSMEKQIFIALDKCKSYTKNTQKILYDNKVLQLSKDNELFGFSWSKEKQ